MICFLLNDSMRREFCINMQNSRRIESELVVQGDGLEFPRSLNMLGLGKLGNIGRLRQDSCCCEMRTWLISPRSLSHIGSATYHMSNYFQIKISSLLFSKICLSLACSRGGRRHLWSLSACDQILSLGEQTWLFFDITKEFCPLVRLPQVRVTHE